MVSFADHGWSGGEEEVNCVMEFGGNSTIWERPSSWNAERKAVLIALLYWCPSIVSVVQSMSGRLRSPLIQMVADLMVFTM